jgi:hypothetical protein
MENTVKAGIVFILLAGLMLSCEKGGNILHKVKYTTEAVSVKSANAEPESVYSGLGDYITSITPRYFGAKMNILMYLDHWDQWNQSTHMISYIDGHDNDPNYEISLYVDFSNNQETSYVPILYSTDKRDDIFLIDEVTFDYFYMVPYYFEQEFEVPALYGDHTIMGNNGTYTIDSLTGQRLCKVTQQPFLEFVFGHPDHQPFGYFFGNTDSTYIFNRECAQVPLSENHPNGGNRPMIRSNKFTPVTVAMPLDGGTIEMYSIISFDTENLIQVYAGMDNIPYTADDIFVYAPNYWERLQVKLEVH